MSGLIPTGSQQPTVQAGQSAYVHSGSQPSNQNNLSPYGLQSINPNGSSYTGLSPQSNLLNSTACAPQSSIFYNPSQNSIPQSTHQTGFGKGSLSTTDINSVKFSSHIENNGSVLSSPLGVASPLSTGNSHVPVQNGPYASPLLLETKPELMPEQSSNINGVNGSHSEHLAPMVSQPQWSSPGQIPPPPGHSQMLSRQLPVSVSSANQTAGHRNLYPSSQVGSKIVPDTAMVPSPGLPLPYNSQTTSSCSPQVTPGPSQPPSARSSRNPSPISTQRYDFMEGQFSNKPSPSGSSTNLLNVGHNSLNSSTAQYPVNYPANIVNNSSPFATPPIQSNYLATPGHIPFPNVSPVVSQPAISSSVHPTSVISPGFPKPRYPSQVGYNQTNQSPRPVMTSQPSSIQPPTSMYVSPQPHLPPSTQSGLPDGPVGGVAGYDPQLHAKMAGMSVHSSFSKLWGNESINLLQDRNILPALPLEAPTPVLPVDRPNCSSKIFRCTLTKIPENSSLLQKSRLPFGILVHPFRDVSNLPVIQCNTIVRCRNCRTYINPFVTFVDQRRWQCNLCFRPNDLPEEFLYDPITRSYGDPARRPEIRNSTIEFIAPSDYTLRPPQPAVYLFLLDVSHGACEIGYLEIFCKTLLDHLDDLPGDSRTRIGFITFDGSIHFYNLAEGLNQPHMLIVSDVDEVFLPSPDNLLVNLHESKALIRDLLEDLPKRFSNNWDSNCCLGAALQVAYKLMSPVGGRITVVQTSLPNFGPGMLKNREDPNQRAAKDVSHVGPASDFYKKLALECSSQQIAVDLFLLCSQYIDIATISCISKYSSGCIQYYPGFHHQLCKLQVVRFASELKRYFTRRIGFEAVMRIRCTRGLAIHTFHGNFFVRSTDLLSLPNVNPDIGFGMQIAIEESLAECNSVCFQAAVLYTSSNGERRIRVHTLCLPVVSMLNDVWGGADQEAIIGLVSKMAVDRSVTSSLSDARDALINVAVDLLGAFKITLQSTQSAGALMVPYAARLIPLFVLALLKHVAFRTGVSTKLDERVYAMERMKTLPLLYLMRYVYPTLYPVHALDDKNAVHQDDDAIIPQPVILQLSSEKVDRHGAYILDTFDIIYLYIGRAVNDHFCQNVLGVPHFSAIPEELMSLPELHTPESEKVRNFVSWLQEQRPSPSPIKVIREDSNARQIFLQYMLDDRTESLFSYYEFLQHLRQQVSK